MKRTVPILLALAGIVAATPALADRGPSQDEAKAIAARLTSEGFKNWGKVEFDGEVWKVDDAKSINGKSYDLQLSPNGYGIVKKNGD